MVVVEIVEDSLQQTGHYVGTNVASVAAEHSHVLVRLQAVRSTAAMTSAQRTLGQKVQSQVSVRPLFYQFLYSQLVVGLQGQVEEEVGDPTRKVERGPVQEIRRTQHHSSALLVQCPR
ncbi:hypothetical protein GBAR_LOCUS25315, partial [Geodia barretti]